MFTHYRTQAFSLKEIKRGEADKLFVVFTKEFGRLEVLGKAIRKIKSKLRAGIPLFAKTEIEFIQGKGFKILTDTILIKDFKNIKEDLERLKTAFNIASIANQLIRGQEKDEKIWQQISETFKALDDPMLLTIHYSLLYHHFLFRLLNLLGYYPHLSGCTICQKELGLKDSSFSFEQRGLVCYPCLKKLKKEGDLTIFWLNPENIKLLEELLQKDFFSVRKIKPSTENLKFLKDFSEKYLNLIN